MIPTSLVELHRLQKAAVIALKPHCLESRVKDASNRYDLYLAACEQRRSLVSTRFISTQVGSRDAARLIRAHTQAAFEAVTALLAECERELCLSPNPQPTGDADGNAIDRPHHD
ncbi:MAG TPA: hypothetical protein VH062_01910 [Polyangiaceae bacterium]|nr:hypothetical protein [Polyangiaceae bacterium]